MTTHYKPTEKELEILQVLWTQGPATVRAVNDRLGKGREIGYTTTLKLMQIMFDKGLVSRQKEGKTHIYSAEISEEKTQNQLLDRLLDTAFKGSAMKLVMQALGHKKPSKEELEEIRKYIDQLEGGMK
ncbi:MAG: BlaI/MecI/CopY family transcriptional regulator [Cytophagales bacterium]|nr:BlaI/MecI/CopY family transcriptional regulator [Cytophagales bacterium]